MHELKHIQQMLYGRLTNDDGWKWLGESVDMIQPETNMEAYMDLPWEKEAYTYQELHEWLFPHGKPLTPRLYIGAIGKVKFYKRIML